MMQLRLFALSLFTLLTITISAQFNQLYTSDYGLPNSLVNDITQDTDGMLWIATENGLSCFNGSRFVNYRVRQTDRHSLANNFIRKVCAGDNGQVLLGTVAGVQIYDKHTDSFSDVIQTDSIGVSTSNVNSIVRLKDGSYFVVGYDAYTIDRDKKGNLHVRKNAMTGKITSIFAVTEGNDGDVWCVRQSNGVWRAHGSKVIPVNDENGRPYNFYSICTGSDGRIYAGHTESGLYVYNPKTNHFTLLPGTQSLKNIRDIVELPKSNILCVAMDGSGVRYYDTKKCQFVTSGRFSDPFVDISSQKAHALYIDDEGNIWMALYQLGVYFASAYSGNFGYYGPRSHTNNIIGDRCVTSIMQSHDGSVWVSTDNGGLYGISQEGRGLRHFIADDSATGIPTTLLGLFQDSRHRTWFGSFHRGSGVVDLTSGRCSYVPLQGVSDRIYSVYQYIEDKRGGIWAATMGHGIVKYDEGRRMFGIFSSDDDVQWSDCLFYDSTADILYAGTYDGVVWFHATEKKKKGKSKNPLAYKVCGGTVVYSISRISEKLIGFCTTSGLIIFDTTSKTVVETLTQDDGLLDDNILAAGMGSDGKLWMSSSSGLMRYDLKTKTVEAYSVLDGLQGNEFYKNASLVASDGRLWFGGINGISVVDPQHIGNMMPPRCIVQVASMHANETYIMMNEDGEYVLPVGCNSFTIELSTRPLHMSKRVTYYYKLDNGSWETLPVSQTSIIFSEISSGSHTLSLKTLIGGKETEVVETEIYVPYPWYMRWWAMLLWLILLGGLTLFIYINLRRRHLLRQEVKKHQEEEAISEAKLSFFMNVVHDVRTPLSLILSPLQKLRGMDDDEAHTRLYGVMQKNADRLLRLSNEIMDVRKLNMGKMQLHCQKTAVSELIVGLVDSVRDLGEMRQQVLYTKDNTDGKQMLWLDQVAIEKVMLNLLSNAMKYSQENAEITTEWGIETDQLHVTVTDNGVGIPDNEKELVFKPFYMHDLGRKYSNGTGLGLSLVKALVELHHGEVHVENNPKEQGTRMHFTIPVSEAAYTEEERTMVQTEADNTSGMPEKPETVEVTVQEKDEPQKMSLRRRNIMVVDDDNDIQTYLTDELTGVYNVVSCGNGKEAYETLLRLNNEKDERRMIDVIVSDIMMPEVDGLELCHLIRQNVNLCHIPIILLTAKTSDPDMLSGLQASADAYVTKPFNLEMLTAQIANLLKRNDVMRKKYNGAMLPTESIETPEVKTADDAFMERFQKIVNDNIGNPDMTSDMIAREMGLSRVHMYRKLKELTDQSATNYIRNIRLAKAAEMLSHGKVPVSEVAARLGFRSMSHFSTSFRNLYGVPPTEYMK